MEKAQWNITCQLITFGDTHETFIVTYTFIHSKTDCDDGAISFLYIFKQH